MQKETRGGKYGRNLALVVSYIISNEEKRVPRYRERFMKELRDYSLVPRRVNTPINRGCQFELEGLDSVNISRPDELARLIKEGIHLMYQKQTAKRVLEALVRGLN